MARTRCRRRSPRFAAASMSARPVTLPARPDLFDLALANELYVALLGPVEALVKDKRSLLVVPSGALTALPFHLLVTEKPAAAIPDKLEGYRDAAWLLKRQAVSVLPSVASLKALRGFTRKDQAVKPMTGFGDPSSIRREGGGEKAHGTARSVTSAAYTDFWQGAGVDRGKLAQALPQLPDTADELNAVAKDLGAAAADIHLGGGRQRDHGEACAARRLSHRLFCDPWPRRRRHQGRGRALARAEHAEAAVRARRWPADRKRGGAAQAQCRLRGAVRLQHHRRRQARRRGALRIGALVLLCRRPGALGVRIGRSNSEAATRLTTSTFDLLKTDPESAVPRRCGGRCWPISTTPPRRETPIPRSGGRLP